MTVSPTVSVIVATYNWSSVLRYAIDSVLAQRFADFELIVVGDGCTDDSEAAVRSFDDPRVRWHNLPENSGHQSAPNNTGLELARGRYIAYLGHDDLWHPSHLQALVPALEHPETDFTHSVLLFIYPPPENRRQLMGLSTDGTYPWPHSLPPSAWLHRRELLERIGGWRDYRTVVLPPDLDLLQRIHESGCGTASVGELTVFKFPAALRRDSYRDRPCDEQREWLRRMRAEPDFLYRELMAALHDLASTNPEIQPAASIPDDARPGSLTESLRIARGLEPRSRGAASLRLAEDSALLRFLNREDDIGPAEDRRRLHGERKLPADGLFVGLGWHSFESDLSRDAWRWANRDAEIVLTRPSGRRRTLLIEIAPGVGVGYAPFRLEVLNEAGGAVATVAVAARTIVAVTLPIDPGRGTTFRLRTPDGGRTIASDARLMNFGVFGFRWGDP